MLIFLAAFLAAFWEAAFPGIRNICGAQVDLMPPLIVYAAYDSSTSACRVARGMGRTAYLIRSRQIHWA
jgi:hypothetical protein